MISITKIKPQPKTSTNATSEKQLCFGHQRRKRRRRPPHWPHLSSTSSLDIANQLLLSLTIICCCYSFNLFSSLITKQVVNAQQQQQQQPEIETFYIRKGANGTLPCLSVSSADGSDVSNKIEWFKEDRKLAEIEDKRVVAWTTKNSIAYLPETGALLFRGVINDDSGEYRCLLTRSKSGEIVEGIVRFYVQDVPDPPQMPIITGFTQRSVSLSWVPGLDFHYSPILNYVIHVREKVNGTWDVENGVMTPDNKTQYEIINLKPFTTYSFRVLAVNAIGISEPSPESHYIITLRQKPSSRVDIISARNVSANAIKLEWLPPAQNDIHGEFLGFRIRYVHQLPEPNYAATLPPHSSLNQLTPSNASTSSGGFFSRFSSSIGASSSSSSNNAWQNSNEKNNIPPAASTRHVVEQPTLNGPFAKEIIAGDPTQTSYVIKNLNTFTLYKFSVQIMNPAGDGPAAEVQAMTDEGVPSAPTDVKIAKTTDTSIKLRWSEPKSPNGIILGYLIKMHDIGKDQNDTREVTDPLSIMESTIGNLSPLTWYTLYIQAYSRRFQGEPSQLIKFRTDVSAPSAPQAVNLTCWNGQQILIRWLKPKDYYDQIDYYYVQYKTDTASEFTETQMRSKDKPVTELLITDLTPNLHYELKVSAGTKSHYEPNLVYKSEQSPTLRVLLQENCEIA